MNKTSSGYNHKDCQQYIDAQHKPAKEGETIMDEVLATLAKEYPTVIVDEITIHDYKTGERFSAKLTRTEAVSKSEYEATQ